MNRMKTIQSWMLCSALLFGLLSTAFAQSVTLFEDNFENPVVTGRTECSISGWSASYNGSADTRIGLWNEDSGTMNTPYGNQSADI